MSRTDNEIDSLCREITDLQVSTNKKISALKQEVYELKRRRSTVTPAKAELRHSTGHVDRYNNRICIGDTVEFLTSGRYDSKQGLVSGYTKDKVIATDYKEREIKRAAHNVRVVNSFKV